MDFTSFGRFDLDAGVIGVAGPIRVGAVMRNIRALKFGDFTLASGKKAKYYLDGKQITLDSISGAEAEPVAPMEAKERPAVKTAKPSVVG